MKPIIAILTVAALASAFVPEVFSAEANHPLVFSGSRSIFQGGPTAGFDYSGSIGGDVGISFRARANSGSVSAKLNGVLRATFPATVLPNASAAITLQYIGNPNGGSLSSDLGASVNVDGRVKFSTWAGDVNERVPIIGEGFYLNPNKTFTPVINSTATGSDVDTAASFGPSIDILVGELGAYVNVNVMQTIQLTPTALNGTMWLTNQTTGLTRQLPFSITPGQTVNLTATNLDTAFWDFAITGITLQNSFRNDVNLVLNPYIDYIVDVWSPGSVPIGLIDQTFPLPFNTLQIPIAFTLESQTPQAALATSVEASSLLNISSPTGIVYGVTCPNPWFAQSGVTHGTATAARTGITPPGQGSFMEATFDGPGVLTYWCKVSSTLNHDFLIVESDTADITVLPWLSGEVNWQQNSLSFTNVLANDRTHKVKWGYTTSFYGASGLDAAFVDQVVFTPAPLTFERAMDSDKITNITSPIQGNYTAAWFPQTNVTHDGRDAMRSGAIADDQWSQLNGSITGPGRLSFWWKTSTGVNDRLYFYLDGLDYLVPFLSGTSAWTQASIDIPAGTHSVGWLYDANFINTQPGGAGFVDEVTFTPHPFTYTTGGGIATITGYTGSGGAVTIPDTIAGFPVRVIQSNAFLNQSAVTSVTLGTNVWSIGNTAFQNCTGLTNVTISQSVFSVGYNPFAGCQNLLAINVDSLNPEFKSLDGVLFNKDLTWLLHCPAGKTGEYTAPGTVTDIGVAAFYRCAGLTNIVLPYGLNQVLGEAFLSCSNLTSILVPSSVTYFGDFAFSTCPNLTGVYCAGNTIFPGTAVFSNANNVTVYYSQSGSGWGATYAGRPTATWNPPASYLFFYETNNNAITLTRYIGVGVQVNVPSTINGLPVVSIGSSTFLGQSGVLDVTISNGVTDIADSAFSSCSSLVNVAIPNTVTNIGISAFRACTNLTSIVIPSGVRRIGDGAFSSCTRLASVTILNGVTSIGSSAFQNCPSLTRITIPNTVTALGNAVFRSCTNLTSVYFEGNAPIANSTVFLNATNEPASAASIFYLPGAGGWGATFGNQPTALWKPQVLGSGSGFGVQANQFGFNIAWARGTTVYVEACTNLANPIWTPVTTNFLTFGTAFFSDAQTTNSPQKFYRVGSGRSRLTRWASSVLGFSSQYSPSVWSAAQTLGQPDTYPTYGDQTTAWASQSPDATVEFIELGYAAPSPIDSVSIYETYAPGAVSKVSVRNPNTTLWEEVWSGTATPAPAVARIFTVNFPPTSFPVDAIRIDLNSPAVPDWNEIDAVSIGGVTP